MDLGAYVLGTLPPPMATRHHTRFHLEIAAANHGNC
jgi:hypothetical protein